MTRDTGGAGISSATIHGGPSCRLEAALRRRLETALGGTLAPIVLNFLAGEMADATQSWLSDLKHDEVYDSNGYHALSRAADLTREPR